MAKKSSSAKKIKPVSQKPRTIVLVEDEPLIGKVYEAAFATTPHKFFIATNKSEAIDAITKYKPALVLLDLVIPVTDDLVIEYEHPVGFDILELMKRGKDSRQPHVFIITNLESKEYERYARQLGVDRYYIKAAINPHTLVKDAVDVLKR